MTKQNATIAAVVSILALVIAGVIATATGGVPDDAVATIDEVGDIPVSEFDHWYVVVNASAQTAQGAKSKPKPPPKLDSTEGQALTQQVMEFLITADWIVGEAKERGVDISDAEVQRQFLKTKEQSFGKGAKGAKAYKKFLAQSKQSEPDVLRRVRLELLSTKIREQVTKGSTKISDDEAQSYYDDNSKQFTQPAQRDIQQVVAKDEAKANEAKKALDDGQSFAAVVKKYSSDPASKANGGKLPGITEGTQEPILDKAIFKAATGQINGPIKTGQGFVVFKVTRVQAGSKQSFEQSKSGIVQLLQSQKQQQRLDTFQKTFKNKWRARTECADKYALEGTPSAVADCGNVNTNVPPAPKTPPTPPTPPGQKAPPKPVPGQSHTNPPALDNPNNPAGGASASNFAGSGTGGPVLQPVTPNAPQGSQLGGVPGAGATAALPLALGGAPQKGAGTALPQGGLPPGLSGGGAGAAPPPGAGGGGGPPPGQ